MTTTQAWVLPRGVPSKPAEGLRLETIELGRLDDDEVLAEPLFGSWEGNMTHALERDPIDIVGARGEQHVVLGNSGVVRVLKTGRAVSGWKEGDHAVLISVAEWDRYGFPLKIFAYDAPGTVGMLAKRTRLKSRQLYRLPTGEREELRRWAAFSIRYTTAWDNWKVSSRVWRVQMDAADPAEHTVMAWGGGVAFAELILARKEGFKSVLITSSAARARQARAEGLEVIDRGQLADLSYDEARFHSDFGYRKAYLAAERRFLELVAAQTGGSGVAIFIDHIGGPLTRATLKVLARQGVITTAGWKLGMKAGHLRGEQCIGRHVHVHTHGAHRDLEAYDFGAAQRWLPPVDAQTYSWDDIPALADDYRKEKVQGYFPIYQVNAL